MSESSFKRLLGWIDANPHTAGSTYEALRQRLILFFERRDCNSYAEELADLVFDIVANKLQTGEPLPVPNPGAYLHGVARNVLREHRKKPLAEPLTFDERRSQVKDFADSPSRKEQRKARDIWEEQQREQQAQRDKQARLDYLDECLSRFPVDTRTLILEYYREEKRARILNRQRLAARLGLTSNSLAIRAHRIRAELERSLSERLSREVLRELCP